MYKHECTLMTMPRNVALFSSFFLYLKVPDNNDNYHTIVRKNNDCDYTELKGKCLLETAYAK